MSSEQSAGAPICAEGGGGSIALNLSFVISFANPIMTSSLLSSRWLRGGALCGALLVFGATHRFGPPAPPMPSVSKVDPRPAPPPVALPATGSLQLINSPLSHAERSELILGVKDEARQRQDMFNIAAHWFQVDAEGARAWLQASSLP
jgi:hypothetical protein